MRQLIIVALLSVSAWASGDQAPGIVSIVANGTSPGTSFVVKFSAKLSDGSCVTGQIITATGSIDTDTFCVGAQLPGAETTVELWNGLFPAAWPSGVTRFRAVVKSAMGIFTESNAYIAKNIPIPAYVPRTRVQVTDFGFQILATGSFSSTALFGIDGALVSVPLNNLSNGSARIPLSIQTLQAGRGTLTVCDQGQCSQTEFKLHQQ